MTSIARPSFIDSPFFVSEPGNWHLKDGAPPEVVSEFTEFMKAIEPVKPPEIEPKRKREKSPGFLPEKS